MGSERNIDPLRDPRSKNVLRYNKKKGGTEEVSFSYLAETLAANRIFKKDDINWFNKVSRYGYLDPYDTEQVTREFLFFTKPDLFLFGDESGLNSMSGNVDYNARLNPRLANIPFFADANTRHKDSMRQLQYSVKDVNGSLNPFMYLLTNSVTSKLDLPAISAETKESTSNMMGYTMQYRSHSLKSDYGYDFSLSFEDTAYLDVYMLAKIYDEYIRLLKTGEVAPKRAHIRNRIIPEQFSIYKFLIGTDGETILFYSKLTGCYFTDVPRADLADPAPDGFKFSLAFHANKVEDSDPMILEEFNRVSPGGKSASYTNVYNSAIHAVDNDWVRWPKVVTAYAEGGDKQVMRRGTHHDYRLKWIK